MHRVARMRSRWLAGCCAGSLPRRGAAPRGSGCGCRRGRSRGRGRRIVGWVRMQVAHAGCQTRCGSVCIGNAQARRAIGVLPGIAARQARGKSARHGIGLQQIALEPARARAKAARRLRISHQIAAGVELVHLHLRHALARHEVIHMGHKPCGAPRFGSCFAFARVTRRPGGRICLEEDDAHVRGRCFLRRRQTVCHRQGRRRLHAACALHAAHIYRLHQQGHLRIAQAHGLARAHGHMAVCDPLQRGRCCRCPGSSGMRGFVFWRLRHRLRHGLRQGQLRLPIHFARHNPFVFHAKCGIHQGVVAHVRSNAVAQQGLDLLLRSLVTGATRQQAQG